MAKLLFACIRFLVVSSVLLGSTPLHAGTFRVATYNVENYLDQPTGSRPQVKSAEARAKVRESIRALNPDVVALEEIGGLSALMELRASLRAEGLEFRDWEYVTGADTNVHVAVLSRLPIIARRPHTNDAFLLDGRAFRVKRGFAEVDVRVNTDFTFTLLAGHLKSRLAAPDADEAEERLAEAKILRRIVDEHFARQPDVRLIVLGDFNDTKDTEAIKAIIGRGKFKLTDTRPAERNGDDTPGNSRIGPRTITWTYYYGKDDTYSRIDYILLSPAMARDWVRGGTYVLAKPNWGVGSDHRPIVAEFETAN